MAEGLLRQMAGDRLKAFSAGIEPGVIHPLSIEVMREIGIDISSQHSKSLQEYMGKAHFSYLITVCSEAERKCPATFPGMGRRVSWNITDPVSSTGSAAEQLARFRQARDEIAERLSQWITTLS